MTIVATTDTRNSAWANDKSGYGHKMLAKMGWKGGDSGLGKNQQGTSTNLRAVRRADSLGIGAENDSFGDKGWQDTNAGFHGVLASLKSQYSSVGGSDDGEEDKEARKKRKKEEKKRKKKEEKRRAKRAAAAGNSSGSDDGGGNGNGNGIRLAQNKVQAGHARKMREAKDIRNKSAADMAAIFGVKADFYKQPRDWGVVTNNEEEEGKKKKKSKKKSKESKEDNCCDVVEVKEVVKSKRDKKKRKRSSDDDDDGSDSEDRKKSKKDKSKK